MSLIGWFLFLGACSGKVPGYCADREDDPDCDGVPTALDRCPDTEFDVRSNTLGCAENQVSNCEVALISPEPKATATGTFRWSGDCDVYLLQFSDDPSFPAGATRTAARATDLAATASGTEKYWRVQGGQTGNSAGYSTPPREVKW